MKIADLLKLHMATIEGSYLMAVNVEKDGDFIESIGGVDLMLIDNYLADNNNIAEMEIGSFWLTKETSEVNGWKDEMIVMHINVR